MKKTITLLVVLFVSVNLKLYAQTVTETVNFDNYVSPANNDLQNHFYGSGFGMAVSQIQTNGITGGSLLTPDSSNFGNDNATYCSKFKGALGAAYVVSICFKYDTTLLNAAAFERAVSIWLNPKADWNHYLVAMINPDKKFEDITYGWVNTPFAPIPLQHAYWYKFYLSMTFTGGATGDQIDMVNNVYNLGMTGTSAPTLVGNTSGTFNDSILFNDSAISVSINGTRFGGSAYLDNFYYQGIKSPDSCTVTGIEDVAIAGLKFDLVPNPAREFVVITSKFGVNNSVKIYDTLGRIMYSQKFLSPNTELNTTNFPPGIYFVNLNVDGVNALKKLAVE